MNKKHPVYWNTDESNNVMLLTMILIAPASNMVMTAKTEVNQIFFVGRIEEESCFNITSLSPLPNLPYNLFLLEYFPPNGTVRLHVWSTPGGKT